MKNFVFVISLFGAGLANASLIGANVTFQCPECYPPLTQTFVAQQGVAELSPWGQFGVDVEDQSVAITWLDEAERINPGHFILSWNEQDYSIGNAVVNAASTMNYNYGFTSNSVTIDFGGIRTRAGDSFILDLTPASVPEPSSLGLFVMGLLGLYAANREMAKYRDQ